MVHAPNLTEWDPLWIGPSQFCHLGGPSGQLPAWIRFGPGRVVLVRHALFHLLLIFVTVNCPSATQTEQVTKMRQLQVDFFCSCLLLGDMGNCTTLQTTDSQEQVVVMTNALWLSSLPSGLHTVSRAKGLLVFE